MRLPTAASMAMRTPRGPRGPRSAGVVVACLLAVAFGGLPAGGATDDVPCPAFRPHEAVAVPPRVGVTGSVPSSAQDSAVFAVPIGPGQSTVVRLHLAIQFVAAGPPAPAVEYGFYQVKGTGLSNAVPVTCYAPPLWWKTVSSPQTIGITTRSVEEVHVFTTPAYPVIDLVVRTTTGAFVNWNVQFEPCGYPCIEPLVTPGPCDLVADPEACVPV